VALGAFAWWESRVDHPMLDVNFFKNPRFTAASSGITLIFFAMFGSMFLLTQYFQFVMQYSALETGVRLLPMAVTMFFVAPLSARIVEYIGTKIVVASGLLIASLSLFSFAFVPAQHISYPGDVLWRLIVMAVGMGLVMAPATESIMGSLPRAKAGVGSAVNDTTRQVGGALGVAVVGSVMTSTYGPRIAESLRTSGHATPADISSAKDGLGFALEIAARTPGPAAAKIIADGQNAFVAGMHHAVVVAAIAAFVGFIVVSIWLPARAANVEVFEDQDVVEEEAEHASVEEAERRGAIPAPAFATDIGPPR
jgi:MFS family permease